MRKNREKGGDGRCRGEEVRDDRWRNGADREEGRGKISVSREWGKRDREGGRCVGGEGRGTGKSRGGGGQSQQRTGRKCDGEDGLVPVVGEIALAAAAVVLGQRRRS